MAKSPTSKSGSAKIRFIMLDAEISDGDLNQITQAIQNAFKPTTIVQHRVPPEARSLQAPSSSDIEHDGVDLDADYSAVETDDGSSSASVIQRSPRVRRPATPDVVDIDLTSDVAWEDFANGHDPKSDIDKYLTVAAWLKDHRKVDAITAGHVYTCFRAIGWSTAIEDFSGPLRSLKKNKLMGPGPNRGEYCVNHLGIAKVAKLKRS